jgi:outer membrane protein
MNTRRMLLLVALLLAGLFTSTAQESLTLTAAVSMALENNQMLRSARHDLEAARWGRLNALTNFLPKIEIGASVTRIDPESEMRANAAIDFIKASAGMLRIPPALLDDIKPFAYRDTYGTDVTVIQPIYNGGAEFVGVAAANALRDKSEFSYQDTEQEVIARAKIAYFTVLKAEEMVMLARDATERTKRHLDVIQKRADMGMRTRTDVLRWEVQRASDEGTLINAENGLAAARLQLNEVLGVDLNRAYALERLILPDTTSVGAASASVPLSTVSPGGPGGSVSIEDHPSMQMMEANLALADVNVDKSWVNFKPRVNAAFQYGWERNDTPALDGIRPWALSLSVKFPIFNGFGDYTNLERAHEEYERAKAQVETFRRGLLMQATVAQLAVHSARKRIDITRSAQQEAQDVLNAVTRRYESGGASNVDLIDVQTAYTGARTNLIAALYDYQIALVQLARATGKVQR